MVGGLRVIWYIIWILSLVASSALMGALPSKYFGVRRGLMVTALFCNFTSLLDQAYSRYSKRRTFPYGALYFTRFLSVCTLGLSTWLCIERLYED